MNMFSPLTNKQLFSTLLLILALVVNVPLQAQQFSQRIYPGMAPGSEDWTFEEVVQSRDGGNQVYYNVRDPELTAYLPAPESANGTAIIILPGGALRFLSVGQETTDIIEFLNAAGIAVFHLKYRVLQEDLEAPARPRAIGPGNLPTLEIINGNANPMPDHEGLNRVLELGIDDAQEALRIVRSHAEEWNIDPSRVGFLGTSAGGGVAFGALIEDKPGLAPDFVASLFGPSLMDVVLPENTQPIFMVTETGHGPVTAGLIALLQIWIEAGESAELLVFDVPRIWNALWQDRFLEWMHEQEML
jgi:hypothetical protein